MKKSLVALCASLFFASIAVVHCGGDDSSTPSSGGSAGRSGSGGTSTGSGGSSTTTTTGGGTSAGSGGSGGTSTGTGGFGGGFDLDAALAQCPASKPQEGTACPGLVAFCPFGTAICACSSQVPWQCTDLGDAGFNFDGSFGFDARRD
jgi:hypothetical protein